MHRRCESPSSRRPRSGAPHDRPGGLVNTEPQLHSPMGWVSRALLQQLAHGRRRRCRACARIRRRAPMNHSFVGPLAPGGSRSCIRAGVARVSRAAPIQHLHVDHMPPGLAAQGAGIHGQRAAQGAGDAGKEFSGPQAPFHALTRDARTGHAGFGANARGILALQGARGRLGWTPPRRECRRRAPADCCRGQSTSAASRPAAAARTRPSPWNRAA